MLLMTDVGFQGVVKVKEDTAWMRLIGEFNRRKKVGKRYERVY